MIIISHELHKVCKCYPKFKVKIKLLDYDFIDFINNEEEEKGQKRKKNCYRKLSVCIKCFKQLLKRLTDQHLERLIKPEYIVSAIQGKYKRDPKRTRTFDEYIEKKRTIYCNKPTYAFNEIPGYQKRLLVFNFYEASLINMFLQTTLSQLGRMLVNIVFSYCDSSSLSSYHYEARTPKSKFGLFVNQTLDQILNMIN